MKGKRTSGGLVLLAIIVLVCFILKRILPALQSLLVALGWIAALGFVLLIVLLILSGLKGGGKNNKSTVAGTSTSARTGQQVKLSPEQKQILANGRSSLVQLRSMLLKVKNEEVRSRGEAVCASIEKIFNALKEDPEDFPTVRRTLNYYLPSFGQIISKFIKLENSETDMGSMPEKVLKHLSDIETAMNKQYNGLFDDDKLDMNVEIEAMRLAFKRDGLIDENVKTVMDEGKPIQLTL